MDDFSAAVAKATNDFVSQVSELARGAAVGMLNLAMAGAPNLGGSTNPGTDLSSRSRGEKRSPADLDRLSESFAIFVAKNPGLRIEQINKQLGSSTRDLVLPIRKLISSGRVSTKGQKRSTTYFPGKSKGKVK